MKLKTITLGCKVNQYETEFIREGLLGIGYADAQEAEPADLCIVNTCTVTAEGDSKSRQIIRRLARDNPASKIVVMGCYATRAPEEVASLPNVTEVLTDKRELPDLLGRFGVTDVPTGISGFGSAVVYGINRVPRPPARITTGVCSQSVGMSDGLFMKGIPFDGFFQSFAE